MRSQASSAPSFVYAPELGEVGSRLALSSEEGRYVARVCRARPGDRVTATDGRGALAKLRVLVTQPRVEVEIEVCERGARGARAWVWCGAPEGERADWLIEKLAELGIERWRPLQCERAEWKRSAARRTRWERLAIAAMRQSRQRFRMEIEDPEPIASALRSIPPEARCWLATETGSSPGASIGWGELAVAAIGPAEGFSASEERQFRGAGFAAIRLAGARLRTETAAFAWSALWAARTTDDSAPAEASGA